MSHFILSTVVIRRKYCRASLVLNFISFVDLAVLWTEYGFSEICMEGEYNFKYVIKWTIYQQLMHILVTWHWNCSYETKLKNCEATEESYIQCGTLSMQQR
jgi:hypothetical protein